MVQFKCSFCNAPITGKPYIEIIDFGRITSTPKNARWLTSRRSSGTPEVTKLGASPKEEATF